jgi:regulator of protease activity HflC (stomatin/prohibitin superfamily)
MYHVILMIAKIASPTVLVCLAIWFLFFRNRKNNTKNQNTNQNPPEEKNDYDFLFQTKEGRTLLEQTEEGRAKLKEIATSVATIEGVELNIELLERQLEEAGLQDQVLDARLKNKRSKRRTADSTKTKPINDFSDLFFPLGLWIAFAAILFAIPAIVLTVCLWQGYQHQYLSFLVIATALASSMSIFFLVKAILDAGTPIPQRDEVVATLFEKYCGTRKTSGLWFPFPYFGWLELAGVCTEDDDEYLFQVPDDDNPEKITFAPFDLADASLPLKSKVFFRVKDSYNFIFGHEDSTQAMIEYVETYLRRVFRKSDESGKERIMTLEEALLLKANNLIDGFENEDAIQNPNLPATEKRQSHGDFVFEHWGIEVFSIMIIDFELTQAERDALDSVLKARKAKEAAVHTAEITFINADANARGQERLAKAARVTLAEEANGYVDSVKALDGKVTSQQALRHLQEMRKFSNANLIVSGGGNGAGFGAEFGAGSQAFTRNNQHK